MFVLPIPGTDSHPVDLVQLRQVGPIVEIIGACIGRGERPPSSDPLRPGDGFTQVRFKVYDQTLAFPIRKPRVVALIQQIEHDGSWTEIERYTVAHPQFGVTRQSGACTSRFDLCQPNGCPNLGSLHHRYVTAQRSVACDRSKTVHMNDVVYLGSRRHLVVRHPLVCTSVSGTREGRSRSCGRRRRTGRRARSCARPAAAARPSPAPGGRRVPSPHPAWRR